MTLLYADTSALARAYLADEPDHEALRELLLEGEDPVVSSQLATVELAAAIAAAERAHRVSDAASVLRQIDADLSGVAVSLLELRPTPVFSVARALIGRYPLFAADAIHLAVALAEAPAFAAGEDVVLVTHDRRQAEAARSEGMLVWAP